MVIFALGFRLRGCLLVLPMSATALEGTKRSNGEFITMSTTDYNNHIIRCSKKQAEGLINQFQLLWH